MPAEVPMRVVLDGQEYFLQKGTGVLRQPMIEWPDNTRFDGQQFRKDRRNISTQSIDDWSNGLGVFRQRIGVAGDLNRIADAENVDTRFQRQIVLSPLFNTATIVPSRGDLELDLEFIDQLYFVESRKTGSAASAARAYKFAPPFTLGSFRKFVPGGGAIGEGAGSLSAVRAFGGQIVFIAANPSLSAADTIYTAGTLGVAATSLTNTTAKIGAIKPQLGDFGGTVHILINNEETSLLEFRIGAVGSFYTKVFALDTVIGSYVPELVSDGLTMFALAPDGLFDFDDTPAIVVSTERAKDKNGVLTNFRNFPHFKNKLSLQEFDGVNVTSVGYDIDDGLAGEKMGEITAMASSQDRLYAAVMGGTFSHILTMDSGNKWQHYARVPTAGVWVRRMFFSDAPDAIDRLWLIFGNAPNPGYFLNPFINPLQAATYAYVPTGQVTFPIFDGGLSEVDGAFYRLTTTSDKIGSSNMVAQFGLDGAEPSVTLGIVASISEALTYGSPSGLQARRIQNRWTLDNKGMSGTTPIFREAANEYLKEQNVREQFEFIVDIDATAKKRGVTSAINPTESVLGSLDSVRSTRTLVPFRYGRITTRFVKILATPSQEEVESSIFEGERDAFVRLRVAEII